GNDGQPLNFNVVANELVDGDIVTLSASNLPPGATFPNVFNPGPATGTFNWASAAVGTYTSVFYATDVHGSVSQVVEILINPSTPASLNSIGPRSVVLGDTLTFNVGANDFVNGDTVTLSAVGLPAGSTFPTVMNPVSVTGTFNWVAAGPLGSYFVTFTASDIHGMTSEVVEITVNPPGAPPVFQPIMNQTVGVGSNLNFNVAAGDLANFDTVTLFASNLPVGATFPMNVNTPVALSAFDWPAAGPPGIYNITFYASDIHGTVTSNITITVTGGGSPPDLLPIGDRSGGIGAPLTFDVIGNDLLDGDTVTLTVSNLPAGATFPTVMNATSATGTFTWASPGPAGVYPVTFCASDMNGSTCETINITIGNLPTFLGLANQTVTVNNVLSFNVFARDVLDGDVIALTASNVPPGATFSGNTNGPVVFSPFNWASAAPVGVYVVTFIATDQHGTVTEDVTITVEAAGAVDTDGDG
ncbi:MAG: hypothetical protein AAF492_23195, partial [Verrucomicrobiota bacterium]